ncbi:bifunctional WD40 repeat/Small-subunit processome [Babesia duncani]|uniref:Bifunctional WD40 repeat/Small-subunit processome n=1 Tax=Babesia duncani TaxID=323732 RepID=A0AAD9UN52_9APIC|nr:bifunctional WD40 repeat/Small-subunit processome [Babesia duncani]
MGSKEANLVYGYEIATKLKSYASNTLTYLKSFDAILTQHKDRIFAFPFSASDSIQSVLLDEEFINDELGRQVARDYFQSGHAGRGLLCLVDASEDNLYNTPDYTNKCIISTGALSCFAASTNANVLAVAFCNGILSWYNIIACEDSWISLTLVREVKTNVRNISAIAFDSMNKITACGTVDGKVQVYLERNLYHTYRDQQGIIGPLRFHPHGHLLLCGCQGGEIVIYNVSAKSIHTTCQGHLSSITDFDFIITTTDSLGGFVSSSRDGTIALWSFSKNDSVTKPAKQFLQFQPVVSLAVCSVKSTTSKATWRMFIATESGRLLFLDPLDETTIVERTCTFGQGEVRCAKIINQQIVVLGSAGSMCLYNFKLQLSRHYMVNIDGIIHASYCPINIDSTGKCSNLNQDGSDYGFSLEWYRQQLSKGIPMAFILCADEFVRLVAIEQFGESITLHLQEHHHTDAIISLAICKQANLLATGSKDETVLLTDLSNLTTVALVRLDGLAVACLAFKFDALKIKLLACGDNVLRCYEFAAKLQDFTTVHAPTATALVHKKPINAVALSPNGKLVATGSSDKQICIYKIENLIVLGKCIGHRRSVVSVEFMNTTKTLVSSSVDQYIKLWNLVDYTCIKTLQGHTRCVMRAVVLPNDVQILSSGMDGLIKLWNIPTSDCIFTMDHHLEKVFNIEICGSSILSVSGNGLLIWFNDATDAIKMEHLENQRLEIATRSQIESLVNKGDYSKALCLALDLKVPQVALEIIQKTIYKPQRTPLDVPDLFKDWAVNLRKSENFKQSLTAALDFCIWANSKAKTAWIANSLLKELLKAHGPCDLYEVEGLGLKIDKLLGHQAAHITRLHTLVEKSHLLDLAGNFNRLSAEPTESARDLLYS